MAVLLVDAGPRAEQSQLPGAGVVEALNAGLTDLSPRVTVVQSCSSGSGDTQ